MDAAGPIDREAVSLDFADYLDAKCALDERSLNTDVRQACSQRLGTSRPLLRWLDVGTGTAAMVRRLLKSDIRASLAITALDRDARLLDIATAKLASELEQSGYRTLARSHGIEAQRSEHHISIGFACTDLFDFEAGHPDRFDLITAHALMDVVPLPTALSRFSAWLEPGGLLYSTLTYDGDTALFPPYCDAPFETALLAQYDTSMEHRRVLGEATGGARAGRRLHGALSQAGFDVIAYGSSDWNITPLEGRYRDRDADVLRTLLAYIRKEGERHPPIDPIDLARWYGERRRSIERAELGMIVHQLDMLAVRREGFTALT